MNSCCRNVTTLSVILNGGLGNQMFQYAAAKAYAKKYDLKVNLNLGAFASDDFYKRSYALNIFNLSNKVNEFESSRLINFYIKLLGLRQPPSKLPNFIFNLLGIIEPTFTYNKSILNKHPRWGNVMVGYWQDERYFSDIRSEIIADFQPALDLSNKNKDLLEYIKSKSKIVAVHFRCNHELKALTDKENIDLRANKNSVNVLEAEYYEKSFKFISKKIPGCEYLIFSDNPAWVKENYKDLTNAIVLENDRGADWEDIHLMQHCKHHIIANSSFSWWGAWLALSENQIVIAPARKPYTPNIPESWHVID